MPATKKKKSKKAEETTAPASEEKPKKELTPEQKQKKNRTKALALAKKRGFMLKTGDEMLPMEYLNIGLPALDQYGFCSMGHYSVVYGPEHAGKSTTCYWVLAAAQKQYSDRIAVLILAERRFDPVWAAAQGVDLARLMVVDSEESMEDFCQATTDLIKAGLVSVVVVDSISAMTPNIMLKESTKSDVQLMDQETIGKDATKIGQWIRLTTHAQYMNRVATIIIAQARTKGIGTGYTYIDFSGGYMLRCMANKIWRVEGLYGKSDAEYETISVPVPKGQKDVKVRKNWLVKFTLQKDSGPNAGKSVFIPFAAGVGFDTNRQMLDAALRAGHVFEYAQHRFAWTDTNGEEQKFHGRGNVIDYFENNPLEAEALKKKLLEEFHAKQGTTQDEEAVEHTWVQEAD